MGLEAVFARVVVGVAHRQVDRPFDYNVPAHLLPKVQVGCRVMVPFGPRHLEGYVVELCNQTGTSQTRNILEVLDPEPAFDEEAIYLARWMSETYLCPLVTALRCMLPAGVRGKEERAWRWTGGSEQDVKELLLHLEGVDTGAASLARRLLAEGRVAEKALRHRFPELNLEGALATLRQHGLAERDTLYTGSTRFKRPKLAVLGVRTEEAAKAVTGLKDRAPRQAAVLRRLLEGDGLPVEALHAVGGGPQPVKALVQKGLVRIEEREAFSEPCLEDEVSPTVPLAPSPEQEKALTAIFTAMEAGTPATILLHGVTGSGKTEVYLQAIQEVIRKGRQAIVLVPEISLTPQTVARFRARFGSQVAVLHSGLSTGERYDAWQRIRRGMVSVAVGARSAVFAPFSRLGLIVVDEEHEPTYKQEQNPKYHAREVAEARAAYHGAVVMLASATPSLESFYLARQGSYTLLSMPQRIASRPLPPVEVIDMRQELRAGNRSIFSRLLQHGINECLANGQQAILFLNRRGFAGFIVCRDCGAVLKCSHCDVSLTYHAAGNQLRCHYCGHQRSMPANCPGCGSQRIRGFGIGTERVEQEVGRMFPSARVLRMDMDTTGRKGSHDAILNAFASGRADILVGTQMVAKGLDFPNVTLVGVVSADTTLNLPDFRARERTFQLLTQVAGRSGRGDNPGLVVIQTYAPENDSILAARDHNFAGFFATEIENRRRFSYPPFVHLLRVVASGTREENVMAGVHALHASLMAVNSEFLPSGGNGVELLGPAPAPLNLLKDSFRWQITVKGRELATIRRVVRLGLERFVQNEPLARSIAIGLDVNPLGML